MKWISIETLIPVWYGNWGPQNMYEINLALNLNQLLIAQAKLKKSPNCSPEKILSPETICTSGDHLVRVQILVFMYSKERSLQNTQKVRNETLFHWLTKPNRKWKYNDLKEEHSRSPNKSFGRKSELVRVN